MAKAVRAEYRGKYFTFGGWAEDVYVSDLSRLEVNDSSNPGVDHAFRAYHSIRSGGSISGSIGYVSQAATLSNFYAQDYYGSPGSPVVDDLTILAMTNPSRAEVLLPVFLWELKDIPGMLRQAGRILLAIRRGVDWRYLVSSKSLKDQASAHLALQFGWKPLLGDLASLALMSDSVSKRSKELSRLYSPKGLRRRVGPFNSVSSSSDSGFVWSGPGVALGTRWVTKKETTTWAVVHWTPTGDRPNGGPLGDPLNREARNALLGLNPSQITESLWEALPWSWLIDWVIPVSNALRAGNRALARPTGGVVMTTTRVTVNSEKRPLIKDTWELSEGTYITEWHARHLLSLSSVPTASIPLLGAGQLSVLGSLAIQRTRPRL